MRAILLLLFLGLSYRITQAQLVNYSSNLPATDALGRKLPVIGKVRKDRFVGLFYWLWHYQYQATGNVPVNISEYVKNKKLNSNPNARVNYDDPVWPENAVYFWSEPLFGYYINTDKWVLRRHAEMLADAGVDVIFFDCTNGDQVWKPSYTALCEAFMDARKDGILTPQVAFVTALGPTSDGQNAINQLYSQFYKPMLYKDLWFMWKGKPLILAYSDLMKEIPGNAEGSRLHEEIKNFFTFRPLQPDYKTGPVRSNQWGWLEVYPQHNFVRKSKGGFEEMPVSVAQNWSKERGLTAMNAPNVFGRSYTSAKGHDRRTNASAHGLNFQEQWNRALKQDIEMIFVTGWNEWIVGRHREWGKQANAFPDEYDIENSRDIEPMKGGYSDNYYYQMVSNIRKFKGVPPEEKVSSIKSINVDGVFSEWNNVHPEYRAHKGNTLHRDSPGFLSTHYTNTTGRNDIVKAKVTRDAFFVYFYVETADKLTPHTDPNWMTLFIDVDRARKTGWEGYDLRIDREKMGNKAAIEKSVNAIKWTKIGSTEYAYKDKYLELRVPITLLTGKNKTLDFEFKWSDNRQKEGDVMDFWLSGDVAPAGRFNYHYKSN